MDGLVNEQSPFLFFSFFFLLADACFCFYFKKKKEQYKSHSRTNGTAQQNATSHSPRDTRERTAMKKAELFEVVEFLHPAIEELLR